MKVYYALVVLRKLLLALLRRDCAKASYLRYLLRQILRNSA
ncbi:MAG: hypothetical protein N2049_01090 [Anaerolineales bacterium]|nr:hypothetical protein [Anaerolineales bacterium]